ncbi:hypothetical protein [Candidatus Tisiphia endosymbiont of Parasteatoda lunata]|uniref:hypothetical protein n=1 Tax=Candidatus Tisiphia endosymbiont of Parasteatoda lunata TaxID=3066275 RepID=UPI00313AAC43
MKFKFERVDLPKTEKDLKTINGYLTKTYVDKGNFAEIQAGYEEDRINEERPSFHALSPEEKALADCSRDTAWDLFLNLLIGVKETAFYLTMSLINGYGVTQDESLVDLTMSIGVKLGDQKSVELAEDEDISKETQKLADKCIVEIKKHEKEVAGRDVTWEEIMARAKAFDHVVKKGSGHSYCDSIESRGCDMKSFAHYVEPILDEAAYGASSSRHDTSYETCPDTSDSEADTVLAGSTKLYCCEIM